MKTKLFLLIIVVFMHLTSCSNKLHRAEAIPLKKFKEINKSAYQNSYDASRRGTLVYINYDNDKIQILAEPPADAIVSSIYELTSNLKMKDEVILEIVSKYAESITKLSATSVSNTLLRDALYRLNEMQFNSWSFEGNYKEAFFKVLDLVAKVSEIELRKIEKEIKENERQSQHSK